MVRPAKLKKAKMYRGGKKSMLGKMDKAARQTTHKTGGGRKKRR